MWTCCWREPYTFGCLCVACCGWAGLHIVGWLQWLTAPLCSHLCPRTPQKIAARLTKIEKSIFQACIDQVQAALGEACPDAAPPAGNPNFSVKLQ